MDKQRMFVKTTFIEEGQGLPFMCSLDNSYCQNSAEGKVLIAFTEDGFWHGDLFCMEHKEMLMNEGIDDDEFIYDFSQVDEVVDFTDC